MAAIKILLTTTLFFGPPSDPEPAPAAHAALEAPSKSDRWKIYKGLKADGLPRVAKAYLNASDAYRVGIARAYAEADPEGLHPEWLNEAWRVCHRESWCGKWGTPKVHTEDGWAGAQVWAAAAVRGKLHPLTCEEHRLEDYDAVRSRTAYLVKKGRWTDKRADKVYALLDELEDLPAGHHIAAEFSTNGGFGMMAAGNLRRLGSCVGPEAMSDPYQGATAAFDLFATCEVWDGPKGERTKRLCTCPEHTELWVGKGRWAGRSLFALPGEKKSRYRSVRSQCGESVAKAYAWSEVQLEFASALAWLTTSLDLWTLLGAVASTA